MFGLDRKSTTEPPAPISSDASRDALGVSSLAAVAAEEAVRQIELLQTRLSEQYGDTVTLSINLSDLMCLLAWSRGNVQKLSGETVSISGAVEELARTIQNIAELSNASQARSSEAAELVNAGASRVHVAGEAMSEIASAFSGLDARMKTLGEAISSIGGFAKQIENISSQTKLLALNATIEAARAGEAGRGFAVVAAEVKSLSEETSRTTELIRGQLTTLGGVMQSMMAAMNEGGEKVREGTEVFQAVVNDMEGIRGCVGEVNISIASITHMLKDQEMTSESIAKSLSEIARLAEQNEADTKQSTDLIEKADNLIVGTLRKSSAPHALERRMRADHMSWKRKLAECLVGTRKINSTQFSRTNEPFGEGWATANGLKLSDPSILPELRRHYDTLVTESNALVQEAGRGEIGNAINHYMAMDSTSGEVMGKLERLAAALGYPAG